MIINLKIFDVEGLSQPCMHAWVIYKVLTQYRPIYIHNFDSSI